MWSHAPADFPELRDRRAGILENTGRHCRIEGAIRLERLEIELETRECREIGCCRRVDNVERRAGRRERIE
jgi:hypothetical protein